MIPLVDLGPIFVSGLVGVVAGFIGKAIRDRYLTRRAKQSPLRYEIHGKGVVDVPFATNNESLRERSEALQRVSPRLAVLDGWSMIETELVSQSSRLLHKDFDGDQDPMRVAREVLHLPPELLARMERIRHCRNLVAHVKELDPDALRLAATDVVPVLEAIASASQQMSEA